MRIQHNVMALNSYNKLATNNNNLSKNLEKLSSGYKINRAADNAAGLAISEKMRAQITGLETAQQNSKDGISLVQTAEGALTEVHSMLNRMVALTTQASNGIYEDGERQKIQDELDQLNEEIDRIADATNFNGIKLLDGSMSGSGATKAVSGITTDLKVTTRDGVAGKYVQDTAIGSAANLTNGTSVGAYEDFTFSFDDGTSVTIRAEVVDGEAAGTKQLLVNGKKYGTENATAGTAVTDALITQGLADALNEKIGDKFKVTADTTNKKLSFEATETGTSVPKIVGVASTPVKADGTAGTVHKAAFTNATASGGVEALDELPGIEFANITEYDGTNEEDAVFEINGKKFIIADTATKDVSKLSDKNIIVIHGAIGTDDDAIAQQLSQKLGMKVEAADITGGGADDGFIFGSGTAKAGEGGLRLQIGDTNDTYNMLDVTVDDCHADAIGVGLAKMRVDDVDTANQAMMAAKDAIEYVSSVRSKLGAIQNRLDHTLNNLQETTTNLTDAESRIRDTDMAEEMMKYTKNNILIQSSQAMLAQANQVPQGVLQLLQ